MNPHHSSETNRSDVAIVGDFDHQKGRLSRTERHLSSSWGFVAHWTVNVDSLVQICSDNCIFLASTNFNDKEEIPLTWKPRQSTQRLSKIGYIAISHRWKG